MTSREREFAAAERMTEHEALMWNVEKDPWLNASGASLTLLDRPADFDYLRRILRSAITRMPRLIDRVVPGFGRLSTPAWRPDAEFDLGYHLRQVTLRGHGDERELFDMAAQLYNEPLDRTRPLWRFVSITGMAEGRGALYVLMHHVIADGIGQIRMAEMYQQLNRDAAAPEEVDLEAFVRERVASARAKESGGDSADSAINTFRDSALHMARRQLGIARRVAGEVVLWPADPDRMGRTLATAGETAATVINQLAPSTDDDSHGSPLWKKRSRQRHLEHVSVSVQALKDAGHSVGGTLNDAFLAGLAEAAHRYHADREAPAQTFSSSFVLSTRTDTMAGGNSFTPVPVRLAAGPMTVTERLRLVSEATVKARDRAQRTGGFGVLSGIANLLPTSVVTRAGRAQGAKIDFATSNLRGAPFELFCAGAKVMRTIPMGPVAGTGANVTAMSYLGEFEIGLFIDPAAITEPDAFRRYVKQAFADLFAETSPAAPTKKTAAATTTPGSPTKRAAKKTSTKKTSAKKASTNKASAKKASVNKTSTNKASAKKTSANKTSANKASTKKRAAATPRSGRTTR